MTRLYCILLLFPFFAHAQKKYSSSDFNTLKTYNTGTFVSKADSITTASTLKLQPIWQKRKDGVWILAEHSDTTISYFQQVWHFYKQDDTTMVLQFLHFKNADKAIAISKSTLAQNTFNVEDLLNQNGCNVYVKKQNKAYTGYTIGKDCYSGIQGIEYFKYDITISKNNIIRHQTGFDKEDSLIYSSAKNGYNFVRQIKSLK